MQFVFKEATTFPDALVITTDNNRKIALRFDQIMSVSMNEGHYRKSTVPVYRSSFSVDASRQSQSKLGSAVILLCFGAEIKFCFNAEEAYSDFVTLFKNMQGDYRYLKELV